MDKNDRHTPGPWVPSIFGSQVLTGDSWNTICVFCEPKKDHRLAGWEDGRSATCVEANSRLVASAPEMLDALDGLIYAVEAEVNEKGGGGFILARLSDARAVVAKARGADQEKEHAVRSA